MSLQEKIQAASNFHRLFQGLVIILANHRSGVKITPDFRPRLIFKCEGGANVNGAEVVINYDKFDDRIHCYDDYVYKNRVEPDITEKVIKDLLEKINWDVKPVDGQISEEQSIQLQKEVNDFLLPEIGIESDDLMNILGKFVHNPFGDPLRRLFDFGV